MSCRPDVAVITNVSPNHLDKHKDFQDYIDAKRAIFAEQGPTQRLVLNLDDEHTPYYRESARAALSYFSDRQRVEDGAMLEDGMIYRVRAGQREAIMPAEEIRLPGEHNLLNYLAAFAAVRDLADAESCRRVARSFAGVAHRLEHVRELRGVSYINDSIGSSPTRTIAGLHALKQKCILIAGGYDKQIPFDALGDEVCKCCKRVILTGDTAQKIRKAIEASPLYTGDDRPQLLDAQDLAEAVRLAAQRAEAGDIVLLSPACASFDRFKNFEERGNVFKKLVMELS